MIPQLSITQLRLSNLKVLKKAGGFNLGAIKLPYSKVVFFHLRFLWCNDSDLLFDARSARHRPGGPLYNTRHTDFTI